ncbi:uncharacterized protein LOC106667709 [Cimex lectularius]|uniref:Uncharacterized protein n=1 Tax=Cimex lectularius TaxID=79782 RepID=A0A8I6RRR9_CIMLE|nr:uncharacterized protein LOC106667709 [Cimex lectularius]
MDVNERFRKEYAVENNPCLMDFCSSIVRRINEMEDVRIENDPTKHHQMKPLLLTLREEAKVAKAENLAVRRAALKRLIQDDQEEIQGSLLRIGMGFVPTHP